MSLIDKLMTKPWLAGGAIATEESFTDTMPPAKIGLWLFLFSISGLFGLFMVAYNMRITLATDWVSIPKPAILWLNTVLLVLASVAFEWSKIASRRKKTSGMRAGLVIGGLMTLAFLSGQLVAWEELKAAGYFLAANPANSFFYLITGLHGLHLLGGLFVWARTTWRVFAGYEVTLSIELCATYWHFLLLIWVILFGLLLST